MPNATNIDNRKIPKIDAAIKTKLEALRYRVENPNKRSIVILKSGVYKTRDDALIQSIDHDGFVVGYKLYENRQTGCFVRVVLIKIPGYKINELPNGQIDPILNACFDAFIDKGQSMPGIKNIGPEAIEIKQTFLPLYLKKGKMVKIANG